MTDNNTPPPGQFTQYRAHAGAAETNQIDTESEQISLPENMFNIFQNDNTVTDDTSD